MMKEALLGKTLAELQALATDNHFPKYVGKQIADWLYKKRVTTFDQMTNLSLATRSFLQENYQIGRHNPVQQMQSQDGTIKYLFEVEKKYIETVYIPENDRATLCVSSQIGCKMGCKFCMTGTLGFQGNLEACDILNQIFSIPQSEQLTNVVFMGEGEPMDNIEPVLRSLEVLTSEYGCGWSPKRITVSSAGFLKNMPQFLEQSACHVAISLHNPFSEERAKIMPIERTNPIEKVLELLQKYDFSHQRRISFEYIMFGNNTTSADDTLQWDTNITSRHAKKLVDLLHNLPCRVNLIRYHAKRPNSAVAEKEVENFCNYLTAHGIITTVRKSRGEDILAACGMLVNEKQS
ncbi:MAG: 23S rRNA (adenine(2503)-C(2))-methyltransferase RlmN [Paludibacteraceae bacterium]|nr:23S rRNA (adenine(2503)-C(2))-methyltransferase RlmN [Paludibacteraceae bacterium]